MLSRFLGLSKAQGTMKLPRNITYMNSWITKRLTNKTTKVSPSCGSSQDTRGSEAEFSLQDPTYTMWRSITAENVEIEQKPTDQTANIHTYYKERWLQGRKEGRVDATQSEKLPNGAGPSIYRQLAKKHAPVKPRGPRIRASNGFVDEEPVHQSFTGRKMTRAREPRSFLDDDYPAYKIPDKVKIDQTESIGMPTSGAFTASSFKVIPDGDSPGPRDGSPTMASSVNSSSSKENSVEEKSGSTWDNPREAEKKRSPGKDEVAEPTTFSPTTAPSPNFKLASGQ